MTILGGVASSDRLMGGLYNLHNKKALHDEVREEDKHVLLWRAFMN